MEPKTTDELMKILNAMDGLPELEVYAQTTVKETLDTTFPEYIGHRMEEAGMSLSQLICEAQIQRNYGYQILNGTKKPGRDKVIALCMALKLPLSEVQRALTIVQAGVLYPKQRRDSIVIFCINNGMSVLETNDLLDQLGEAIL
ncbi:MAG: helix-turn-helix domain-containing protein [Dorea sp.]